MADEKDSLPPPPPGYTPAPSSSGLPPPPPGYSEMPKPGLLESFGRGLTEGATFGYDDKLGMSKEAREASRKANPWTHFFGEVVGGVAPMAAAAVLPTGAGQVAAAGRGAQLLSRGAGLVRGAMVPGEINSVGQAMLQGSKIGATTGFLSGSGHADVKDDDSYLDAAKKRLGEGLLGGVTGGVIGAPLGAVGHGIYRGGEFLGGLKAASEAETGAGRGALTRALVGLERDKITPDQLIANIRAEFPDDTAAAAGGIAKRFWGGLQNKQPITADQVEEVVRRAGAGEDAAMISAALKQKLGGQGPGEDAVQSLLDEMAARHLGPQTIMDRAANTGKPGSGENTQWTMRAAAATPGEPKTIAREMLLDRQQGAGTRINDFLARVLGTEDFEGAVAQHEAKIARASDRMYAAARAEEQPFDLNPIFNAYEAKFGNKRGPVPDAVMNAINAMRTTQPVLNQAGNLAKQPPGGIVNKAPPMDLDGFIYARGGLFDTIQEIKGKRPNTERVLQDLYNDITEEVARTNPKWKEANDFFRNGKLGPESAEAGANMSLRLNNQSREGMKDFAGAVSAERKTKTELATAKKVLKDAEARQDANGAAAARIEVDRLEGKLEAVQAQQELFKIGLMRSISDKYLVNEGETHNLTKQLLKPGAQKILRQVLGPDADQVINKLKAEAAMHRTYSSQFGSQTTPLREHIDELNWAPNFEAAWSNLGLGKIMQLAQEKAAQYINVKRNTELMKIYTELDPMKQIEFLEAMKNLQTVRHDYGNFAGKRSLGASAGVLPSHEAAVDAERRHPTPVMPVFKQKP